MPRKKNDTVTIQDCQIIFRNFAGKAGKYNQEGRRNFGVILDEQTADRMVADGWNIKALNPRDEGDAPRPWLPVTVSYTHKPPLVVMLSSRGRTHLAEEDVHILDWVEIATADLIVNPYEWDVSGKTGVKAYLKSLFVTIIEDELQLKYADIDDAPPHRERTD